MVIAAAEIFFQPDIHADEQISAAHFFDLEFGLAGPAIAPRNRDNRPTVTANDRFEWQLDGDIKVRSN